MRGSRRSRWQERAVLHALADACGVFRVDQMSLNDGIWKLWRDAPGFSQRFIGTFSDDDDTINGYWEISDGGGVEWSMILT